MSKIYEEIKRKNKKTDVGKELRKLSREVRKDLPDDWNKKIDGVVTRVTKETKRGRSIIKSRGRLGKDNIIKVFGGNKKK